MGKLLRDVELFGANYQRRQEELDKARRALRQSMGKAHEEGISMNKIAKAAGLTREGVRYALKDSGRETADA
jgi:DNA-binding phage protein